MSLPLKARLSICFVAFTAFATWLAIFCNDPARPKTVQEKADLLASENIAAFSIGAPNPPSPPHWAQRGIYQSEHSGKRHPLARDAAAFALALSGQQRRVAGAISFGLAGACLSWLLLRGFARLGRANYILSASLMVAVVHGRDWQLSDPFPFLLIAATSLCLGAWMSFREDPSRAKGLLLGAGLSAVLVCEPALFVLHAALVAIDLAFLRRKTRFSLGSASWVLVFPALCLAIYAVHNKAVTGSFNESVSARYELENTSAPVWIWQIIRTPPEHVDEMLERYDELIALPAARWGGPAVRIWLERLQTGAHYGGGLALALLALAAAALRPGADKRPAWLVGAGMAFVALAYYPLSAAWWAILTPAIAVLAAGFFADLPSPKELRRAMTFVLCLHLVFIYFGPQSKPTAAEYDFAKYLSDIVARLNKEPKNHLVFVSYDVTADARVEPAELNRDWSRQRILYARELSQEKNAELAAAMPDRKPWRMVIYQNQINVYNWPPEDSKKANSPSVPPLPTTDQNGG